MDPTQEIAAMDFFQGHPAEFALYRALMDALEPRYDDLHIKVQKTQITLTNRRVFACASLPRKKCDGQPPLATVGLGYRLDSPRVWMAVEPYPGRRTHHILVRTPEEIDGELLAWIDEAYAFANAKGQMRKK